MRMHTMTKFYPTKTIPELAEIAKSVKCIGLERNYNIVSKHGNYAVWVTLSSSICEVTQSMFANLEKPTGERFNFSLIEIWARHADEMPTSMHLFDTLFGEQLSDDDILDILDYCND